MTKRLNGKKVIVTGASSGIGRGIALCFGAEGAEVALLARREQRLKEVQSAIEKNGGKAHVFAVDLSVQTALTSTIQKIQAAMGEIDILVNNAGYGVHGPLADSTPEEFDRVMNLNMRAVYLLTRLVLPGMLKRKEGTIINIGSIAGKMGLAGSAIYCASKFALHGFSEALLEEVRGQNIRVSVIAPGKVNTELFGRSPGGPQTADYIQPEDVAQAALLCALDTQTAAFKEIVVRPRRPLH